MKPFLALLTTVSVLCLSPAFAPAQPADTDGPPALMEAQPHPDAPDASPTNRKGPTPPPPPVNPGLAERWIEHRRFEAPAVPVSPQAILAALKDPAASNCLAVGKLREMAANEKTRPVALSALENLAQECPCPVTQRAALLTLAEVYTNQGQPEKAARALVRVCKVRPAPLCIPGAPCMKIPAFSGGACTALSSGAPAAPGAPCPHCMNTPAMGGAPVPPWVTGSVPPPGAPCPRCIKSPAFSGGACTALPGGAPAACPKCKAAGKPCEACAKAPAACPMTPGAAKPEPRFQPTPPAAPADSPAFRQAIEQRQKQLRELTQQVEQKEKALRELTRALESKAGETRQLDAKSQQARAELMALATQTQELRALVADLQQQMTKSKAAATAGSDDAQSDLQAQKARLDAQAKHLRQWEMRLRQWEQRLKEAQSHQKQQDDDGEDK